MRGCLDEGVLQSYFDGELSSKRMRQVTSHLATCAACATAARELENEDSLVAAALAPEFAVNVPSDRLRARIDEAIAELQVVSPARVGLADSGARGWAQSLFNLFTFSPQRALAYTSLAVIFAFAVILAIVERQPSSPVAPGGGPQVAVNERRNLPASFPTDTPKAPPQVSEPGTPGTAGFKPIDAGYNRKKRPVPSGPVVGESIARVRLLPGERSYLRTIASLDTTIKSEGNRQMRPALQAEYERNLALVDRAIAATRNAAKSNPNDPDAADFMFAAYQSKVDLLNTVADARISNRQH